MLQDPASASSASIVMQIESDNINFIFLVTLHDIRMFLPQTLPQSGVIANFACVLDLTEAAKCYI